MDGLHHRSRTGSRSLRASSGSRSASGSIEPFKSAKDGDLLRSPSRAALEVRIFWPGAWGVRRGAGRRVAAVVSVAPRATEPLTRANRLTAAGTWPPGGPRSLRKPNAFNVLGGTGDTSWRDLPASQAGQVARG
jgi:hypothetical protein